MTLDRSTTDHVLDQLHAQLQARARSGGHRLADDEVADLLGYLVLASLAAGSSDPITRDEEALLMRLAKRLGVAGSESTEQRAQRWRERVNRIAIDPNVLATLREAARGLLAASDQAPPAQQRLLGRSKSLRPLAQNKRPGGTVRAGPAARFQLGAKTGPAGRSKRQQNMTRSRRKKGDG